MDASIMRGTSQNEVGRGIVIPELQERQKPVHVSRQGCLWRRGEVLGGWKKRWVVLVGDHLYGFTSQHEFVALDKPDFCMDVHGATVSMQDESMAPGRPEGQAPSIVSEEDGQPLFTFCVTSATSDSSIKLAASSLEDCNAWIESIDQQSYSMRWIKISGSRCEGYLVKKGQRVRNWKRRYFVLLESNLYYFRLKFHTDPAGVIPLRGACILQNASAHCRKSRFSFGITPRGSKRTYIIYASSDGDRHKWLDAIVPSTFDFDGLPGLAVDPGDTAKVCEDDSVFSSKEETSMESIMARFDRKFLVDLRSNADNRQFLLEGSVKCLQEETIFDRRCFLFNDVIVLAEQEDAADSSRLRQREAFWLNATSISRVKREGFVKDTFDLIYPSLTMTIGASSEDCCSRWIKLIFKHALQCRPPAVRNAVGARHEILRGSAHSAALLGDTYALGRFSKEQLTAVDEDGYTPLHLACYSNRSDSVIVLLKSGASPLTLHDGCTPLDLACRRGHVDTVRAMCSLSGNSAIVRESFSVGKLAPLWVAVFECDNDARGLACAKELADAGCDVNQLNVEKGMSVLHFAAHDGQVARARSLVLDIGASVSARSADGKSVLFYAVQRSSLPLVRFFLQCGSQPNARDRHGNVPLHFASSAPIMLLLLEHGARLGLENSANESAGVNSHRDSHSKRLIRERIHRFTRAPVPLVRRNPRGVDLSTDWIPDSTSSNCLICENPFSIFARRHHCRNCGILVCNACSGKQCQFEPTDGKRGEASTLRVCDGCFNLLSNEGIGTINMRMDEDDSSVHVKFSSDKTRHVPGQMEQTLQHARAVYDKASVVADKSEILASDAAEFAQLTKQLAAKYK